jgi:hypothetical protein
MVRKITVLATIFRAGVITVRAQQNLGLCESVVELSEDRKAKHPSPVSPPARWRVPGQHWYLSKQDFCQSCAKCNPLMAQGERVPLSEPRPLKMSNAGRRCPEANSSHRSAGFMRPARPALAREADPDNSRRKGPASRGCRNKRPVGSCC